MQRGILKLKQTKLVPELTTTINVRENGLLVKYAD